MTVGKEPQVSTSVCIGSVLASSSAYPTWRKGNAPVLLLLLPLLLLFRCEPVAQERPPAALIFQKCHTPSCSVMVGVNRGYYTLRYEL